MPRSTELAHLLIRPRLQPGDCAIDATLGNGHDAIFLARLVGEAGRVWAFDPQPAAHAVAMGEFKAQGMDPGRVTFLQAGHETMAEHVTGGIQAIMFNLGYLPGGDKSYTTRTSTTLTALHAAVGLLARGGVLTVVAYPGHAGGDEEGVAAAALLAELPTPWKVYRYESLNAKRPAPYLLVAERE